MRRYRNVYVVGECVNLGDGGSGEVGEVEGEEIGEVLKKEWNKEGE